MKNIFVILSLVFAANNLYAEVEVLKTCHVTLKQVDSEEIADATFKILSDKGYIGAQITQVFKGRTSIANHSVSIMEGEVRADLDKVNLENDDEIDNLSLIEKTIAHAISVTSQPELQEYFSAGLDLKKVRSAKLYTIGEQTIGHTSIVEAKDAEGKDLGSFLGGLLVSPCK